MIPIYRTYDSKDEDETPIGVLSMEENRLKFRFKEPISIDKVFEIFGNTSIFITEVENKGTCSRVIAGEILHYAYMAD